jgi:prepilin-type N-terminal cleavage/methylation domain-containing protein
MRRAFTLIEVLVVVAVMPVVLVVISRVYATFICDIPRTTRVLQVNTTVLDALRQIRRDVDGAVGLPEQFADRHAGAGTLLIEQPGRVICYQLEDGRIVRTPLAATPPGVSSNVPASTPPTGLQCEEQRLWRVPEAGIAWRPWTHDGKAYAVEIHSCVRQRSAGRVREKLANSQVFFLQELVKEGGNQ